MTSRPLDLHAIAQAHGEFDLARFVDDVVSAACIEYRGRLAGEARELLEFDDGHGYRYVFDLAPNAKAESAESRVVVAWGRATPTNARREASRLRGFPIPPRPRGEDDRGHLFAHAAGGGLDVNLFAQARELNRGWSASGRRWRSLERLALRRAGAVLVVRLLYADTTARPAALEAVLAADDGILRTERLTNS